MKRTSKKVLSVLLILALLLTLLPLTAFAEEVQEAVGPLDLINRQQDLDWFDAETGDGWGWDVESLTLTLKNAHIRRAVILPDGAKIVVEGENFFGYKPAEVEPNEAVAEEQMQAVSAAVTMAGSLTIEGKGADASLSIRRLLGGIYFDYEIGGATNIPLLTIDNVTLEIKARGGNGNGIEFSDTGKLDIKDSEVIVDADRVALLLIGENDERRMSSNNTVEPGLDTANSTLELTGGIGIQVNGGGDVNIVKSDVTIDTDVFGIFFMNYSGEAEGNLSIVDSNVAINSGLAGIYNGVMGDISLEGSKLNIEAGCVGIRLNDGDYVQDNSEVTIKAGREEAYYNAPAVEEYSLGLHYGTGLSLYGEKFIVKGNSVLNIESGYDCIQFHHPVEFEFMVDASTMSLHSHYEDGIDIESDVYEYDVLKGVAPAFPDYSYEYKAADNYVIRNGSVVDITAHTDGINIYHYGSSALIVDASGLVIKKASCCGIESDYTNVAFVNNAFVDINVDGDGVYIEDADLLIAESEVYAKSKNYNGIYTRGRYDANTGRKGGFITVQNSYVEVVGNNKDSSYCDCYTGIVSRIYADNTSLLKKIETPITYEAVTVDNNGAVAEVIDGLEAVYLFTQNGRAFDYHDFSSTMGTVIMRPTANTPAGGRISGDNRYETAVEISKRLYPEVTKADVVFLANGLNYPDALAAIPLAYEMEAPILLMNGTNDSLDPATIAELNRLAPKTIYLLGGEGVMSANFKAELYKYDFGKKDGFNVIRLGGSDRYETAARIADEYARLTGKYDTVFIASGLNYPDALSAGSAAATEGAPILFVGKDIPEATAKRLASAEVKSIYVLGGRAAVSESVYGKLQSYGKVVRLAGDDRFETCVAIQNQFFPKADGVYVATGMNFADALTGGVMAASDSAPMVLVNNNASSLSKATSDYLGSVGAKRVVVFGGRSAVSDQVVRLINQAAGL